MAHLRREVQIAIKTVTPPIGGQRGLLIAADVAGRLLPRPPIVVGVVTLNLMGSRRRAPLKVGWKMHCGFSHEIT